MNAQDDFVTPNSVSIGNIFYYSLLSISTKKCMTVDILLSFIVIFLN
jgi:hypothetical protein